MNAQLEEARQRMDAIFPTRGDLILFQLRHFAETGQKFDATFYDRAPILDVGLNREYARTLVTALGNWKPDKIAHLLKRIHFDDGTVVRIGDIWVLNYMPPGGITIAMLENADIVLAEVKAGNNDETVREMIRTTYRCATPAEEDWHVRRWIAS